MSAITYTPPPGYWQDANGNLVPEANVKQIDQVRNNLVYNLCQMAEAESLALAKFKASVMKEVASFCDLSMLEYNVQAGGDKGNVSLASYDGKYKVIRQVQSKIVFGEQLMAAKALIDACVREWAPGANVNIMALVNHAFQTDQAGKINTERVLSLRRLDIKDEKWQNAMKAIQDSMRSDGSKPYVRFYKRDEATLEYKPITLDLAAL